MPQCVDAKFTCINRVVFNVLLSSYVVTYVALLDFRIFFKFHQYHGFSIIIIGEGVRGEDGWEAEGRLLLYIGTESSHCVLIEVQKEPQCTCQAEMVVDSKCTVLLRDNVANEPLSLLVSHSNSQTTRESKRTELTPL